MREYTLKERAMFYNKKFPRYSKQMPMIATNRWLSGTWMIGNDFRNKNNYYGEYPPKYLERVYSLFPDIESDKILHLFSGSLNYNVRGDRVDLNPDLNPTHLGDAHKLSEFVPKDVYELIIADPPYSEEDAKHYGTTMINRNKVIRECAKILKDNGFIVWLDQVLPMYNKMNILLIGHVGVIRSTNHRVRMTFIWEKLDINDKTNSIVKLINKNEFF